MSTVSLSGFLFSDKSFKEGFGTLEYSWDLFKIHPELKYKLLKKYIRISHGTSRLLQSKWIIRRS